jgi:hypothetical protein
VDVSVFYLKSVAIEEISEAAEDAAFFAAVAELRAILG